MAKGQGFHETPNPITGKCPEHVRNAKRKSAERISNAEIVPESERKVTLYLGTCDDIAVRILKSGWNPELFTQKQLELTTIEQFAGILAKRKNCRSVIKVIGIPEGLLEPSPQYEGKISTKEIIDKESVLVPYKLILKTALPKECFVGRKGIPNMPDMIDMDSPDFLITDYKKYTPRFLKSWHVDRYLQALRAKDIERMFFIQKKGSVLDVPDNTKVYMARYIPTRGYVPENLSKVHYRWNPDQAEVVE